MKHWIVGAAVFAIVAMAGSLGLGVCAAAASPAATKANQKEAAVLFGCSTKIVAGKLVMQPVAQASTCMRKHGYDGRVYVVKRRVSAAKMLARTFPEPGLAVKPQ